MSWWTAWRERRRVARVRGELERVRALATATMADTAPQHEDEFGIWQGRTAVARATLAILDGDAP